MQPSFPLGRFLIFFCRRVSAIPVCLIIVLPGEAASGSLGTQPDKPEPGQAANGPANALAASAARAVFLVHREQLPASRLKLFEIQFYAFSPPPSRRRPAKAEGISHLPSCELAAGVVEVARNGPERRWKRVRGDGWTLPANQKPPFFASLWNRRSGPMPGLASGCRWPEWFADTRPAVRIGRQSGSRSWRTGYAKENLVN